MYLHQELREVSQYRQAEALKRIDTLHRLMAGNSGFIRSLACRDPGRLGHYAWFRFWDTSEDHAAFRRTDASKQFGATKPDGLYWELPDGVVKEGHWQSVLTPGDLGAGGYLLRFAYTLLAHDEQEFLEHQGEFLKLVAEAPGLHGGLTFAGAGEGAERSYLTLVGADSPEAYRAFLESPAGATWRDAAGNSYPPLARDCYEVVEEVRPG
jgi:heme-degrading monooxygenase HmoA